MILFHHYSFLYLYSVEHTIISNARSCMGRCSVEQNRTELNSINNWLDDDDLCKNCHWIAAMNGSPNFWISIVHWCCYQASAKFSLNRSKCVHSLRDDYAKNAYLIFKYQKNDQRTINQATIYDIVSTSFQSFLGIVLRFICYCCCCFRLICEGSICPTRTRWHIIPLFGLLSIQSRKWARKLWCQFVRACVFAQL